MSVIQIRGSSGSGKSWIIHQLKKRFSYEQTRWYLRLTSRCIVVGRYNAQGGGPDSTSRWKATDTMAVLEEFADHNLVICEGQKMSMAYRPWMKIAERWPTRFFALSTPYEECVRQKLNRLQEQDFLYLQRPKFVYDDKSYHRIQEVNKLIDAEEITSDELLELLTKEITERE